MRYYVLLFKTWTCFKLCNPSTYKLPFRILTAKEVLRLSGLENHWTMIDVEDANRLPDHLIRDMCGNSFHPALISSAFGDDAVLKRWIQGEEESAALWLKSPSRFKPSWAGSRSWFLPVTTSQWFPGFNLPPRFICS